MSHTLTFQMPTSYEPPYGTPLYWRDEVTGVLGAAMWAYISHSAEPDKFPAPTADQLALVIAYLKYVINAPCWRDSTGVLERLRASVETLETVKDVQRWVMRCVGIGLDPL